MNKHIKDVCRIGQDKNCCRYLTMGVKGWSCGKNDFGLKNIVDKKVESGSFISQGDNCDGKTDAFLNSNNEK